MVALRVNSKSAHVIAVPSAHLAAGLMWNVTEKGLWVIPPLSRLGASVSRGELVKVPCRVNAMARGYTYCVTDQYSHEAEAHCVRTLMHSGYCSAPRTIFPPWTGLPVAAGEAPPPPPPLLQAAPIRPATAIAATVRPSHRPFIPSPPFSPAPFGQPE